VGWEKQLSPDLQDCSYNNMRSATGVDSLRYEWGSARGEKEWQRKGRKKRKTEKKEERFSLRRIEGWTLTGFMSLQIWEPKSEAVKALGFAGNRDKKTGRTFTGKGKRSHNR